MFAPLRFCPRDPCARRGNEPGGALWRGMTSSPHRRRERGETQPAKPPSLVTSEKGIPAGGGEGGAPTTGFPSPPFTLCLEITSLKS